ncbi:ABC transporter substrate-binding protein [Paenibacillus albiflavus]|nr:extracellular solute-binding protein [Paenibacillus albiflavus]
MKLGMRVRTLVVLFCLIFVFSGCSMLGDSSKDVMEKLDPKKNFTIKVMSHNEQYFMQQFGYLFMAKYPNIDIEVVSTQKMYEANQQEQLKPEEMYQKFIETNKPDVIVVFQDVFEKLAADQLFYDLDPVIAQDKFDIQNIQPQIIDYLKLKGGGKLFGLAPKIQSQALFINRDMFNKHGVQLPEGPLTWETVLNTAQRFPTDGDDKTRSYGFTNRDYQTDPYSLIVMIGTAEGLIMQNEGKAALNTPSWKKVFELVSNAYKTNTIVNEAAPDMNTTFNYEDYLMRNKFTAGRAAMTIGDLYLIQNMRELKEYKKDLQFNWEVISLPKDAESTQRTNFDLTEIFAVNAKSENQRAAWEFVKYVNSDEFARVHAKTPTDLWSRSTYLKSIDGVSLEPFYQLSFNSNEMVDTGEYRSAQYMLRDEANKIIDEYLTNKKNIDQVLAETNDKLQANLDQITEQMKKKDEKK